MNDSTKCNLTQSLKGEPTLKGYRYTIGKCKARRQSGDSEPLIVYVALSENAKAKANAAQGIPELIEIAVGKYLESI